MVTVAVSGGFDPVHKGHVRHIKAAMKMGDKLIVILTRDDMLIAKKGKVFMDYSERAEILAAMLRDGDWVVPNVDKPGSLVSTISLRAYRPDIFAKGGDTWDDNNLPEATICEELGIEVVFGVGGTEKIQSSANLTGLKSIRKPVML